MLVVATYPDTEEGLALRAAVADLRRRSSTEVLTLRPWDDADVAMLLPAGVHPSWAPALRRTSAGLPLLVTALLQDLLDTDRGAEPAPADGAWPLGAPDRLADLTAERLARLDSGRPAGGRDRRGHRDGLRTGTLLGRLGEPAGAAAVTALENGVEAGLLVRSPTVAHGYDLTHALLRDAVYARGPRPASGAVACRAGRGDRGGRPAG